MFLTRLSLALLFFALSGNTWELDCYLVVQWYITLHLEGLPTRLGFGIIIDQIRRIKLQVM